jgi:hypothetical protein
MRKYEPHTERNKRMKEAEMRYLTARHDDAEFVIASTAMMRVFLASYIVAAVTMTRFAAGRTVIMPTITIPDAVAGDMSFKMTSQ